MKVPQAVEFVISADEEPFFVRLKEANQIFLLAETGFADLDEEVPAEFSFLEYFCRLAPALMFIRHAFPDEAWRNDHPSACFIVDDPLLKPRYGFLEFESA